MSYIKRALFVVFASFMIVQLNAQSPQILDIFSKNNIAWANASTVKSKKAGYTFPKEEEPAEIWFSSTSETSESFAVCLKSYPVGEYDYLLLKYRVMPDTYFTLDVWWEKGKQTRPLSHIKGDGEWKVLKLPVASPNITLSFSISGKPEAKTAGRRQVFFSPIQGIKEGLELKDKIYIIKNPVLIPEPKKYSLSGDKLELKKGDKPQFTINLNKKSMELKNIIKQEIAEYVKVPENSISDNPSANNIINLEFGDECDIQLPDQKEAYAIKFSKSGKNNIITLAAKDNAGLYWAWQTLRQLMEETGDSIEVNVCDITDWPDYSVRMFAAYNIEQEKLNLEYKFNLSVLPWWIVRGRVNELSEARNEFAEKYINTLKSLCNYAVARGTNAVQWLGPFFEKNSITVSDDKQINELFKLYEISLKTGNKTCILSIDDGGRRKDSFTSADQQAYNNDRLLSHAYFIKKLSDKIYSKYPDAKLFAITSGYENTEGIKGYYDRIGVSKNVIIIWTGVQCVTFDYPEHIIKEYAKGIEGRNFCIGDNTPSQAYGMYRGLTICDKYAAGYKNLYNSKQCTGVFAQSVIDNQMNEIFAQTASEYFWNASKYDVDRAVQRAIAKTAGNIEAVKPILLFRQEYLKIAYKYPIDKCISPKKNLVPSKRPVVGRHKLDKREIAKYSIDDEDYKKLCAKISFLGSVLKEIEQKSRNNELTDEFKLFYSNMKEIITHIRENSMPTPVIEPEKSYAFNINNIPGGTNYQELGPDKHMSTVIYGNQTANNTLTAIFNLKSLPAKDFILELAGWDCDKNMPLMLIKINNKKIFSGKTTFGHTYPCKTGPGKMTISVPAKYLIKGKNRLEIINDAPASDLIDNWIIVGGMKFIF